METIVARGYHKFFNLNEREETTLMSLRNADIYPLEFVEKLNGFLGILSTFKDDNDEIQWWISSKTTNSGKHANIFKELINQTLTDSLKHLIHERNVSLLFEVIHPTEDPHIIEYDKPKLVFLDAIKNVINFELDFETRKLVYNDHLIAEIEQAKVVHTANNFKELTELIEKYNSVKPFDNENYIEGFVIRQKDKTDPFMFKLKTKWYSFWKYMRSIKDRVYKQIEIPYKEGKDIKGNLPVIKKDLHTFEENYVFNTLVELAKTDTVLDKDIISIRKLVFESLEKEK